MNTLAAGAIFVMTALPAAATSWSRTYGSGVSADSPRDIQPTSDGGLVVIGYTQLPGAGDDDLWILKLAATGEIEWQAAYGGRGIEWFGSIQQLPDGGYIVAAETRSFDPLGTEHLWLLRLDAAGNILWQRLGDASWGAGFTRVRALRDGGWIVAGDSSTAQGWQLTRFEADGDIAWQEFLGSPLEQATFYDIVEADDGTLLACGEYGTHSGASKGWIVRLNASGAVLRQKAYDAGYASSLFNIRDMGAEGVVAAGRVFPATGQVQWVLRLNYDGDVLWQGTYAAPGGNVDSTGAVLALPSGFVIAGGTRVFGSGSRDGLILRLDDAGNILGQRVVGGTELESLYWLTPTGDGGYVAGGYTFSFGAGFEDMWLLRHDALDNLGDSCDFVSESALVRVESMPVVYETDAVVIPTTPVFTPTDGVRTPTNGVTTLLCEGAPLDCDDAEVSPAILWPPDHRMIPIEVRSPSLTTAGGSIVITGVRSDEPVDDRGDGRFAPDAVIQGGSVVLLRAERDGRGNGRVYTIDFTGTDASGGTCDGSVTVGVPKSQGRRMGPIDDGSLFDATAGAPSRRGGRGPRPPRP